MSHSRLSKEAREEMLRAAADPRYREMNRFGPACGATSEENYELFMELMYALAPILFHDFKPSREIQKVTSFIL